MRRANFPTQAYKELYKECPPIPAPTCPYIDKAQQYLEELRDQNEALRDAVKYWREISMDLLKETCVLNRYTVMLEKE
jgi:hypothetical protein